MKVLLLPRGSTGLNDAYTGPSGQLTMDLDRNELRLHDGVTPGGHRILNLEQLLLLFMAKDSEFGEVAFAEPEVGYLVRIGDRQYALREIEALADGGIVVTDGPATAANTVLSIDTDWLDDYIAFMKASKIHYITTTGTGAAYIATLPVGFPLENGTIFGVRFHAAAAATATISVNASAPVPIFLTNGSLDLEDTIGVDTRGILMQADSGFLLVGVQNASGVPITPIAGMTATNVQEALEELKAGGDEEEDFISGDLIWKFGALTDYVGNPSGIFAGMTNGQAFLYMQAFLSTTLDINNNPVTSTLYQAVICFKLHDLNWCGGLLGGHESADAQIEYYYTLPPLFLSATAFFALGTPTANFFQGKVSAPVAPWTGA